MERKKFLNVFDTFETLVFVINLADYDQTIENDAGVQSKWTYALKLLEDLNNDENLKQIPMILILNQIDSFSEKLGRRSLKVYFPNYSGNLLQFIFYN